MFNAAQLHLLVNHLPIIGLLLGILILTLGVFSKNQTVSNVALGVFIFAAIGAFLSMRSGEGAEDIVKQLKVTQKGVIHEHEESAELFSWLMAAHALTCLVVLISQYRKKKLPEISNLLILFGSVFIMYFAADTGHTGGLIRHPEISNSPQTEVQNQTETEKE
jgi:uncharacterized membrane protein